MSLHSCEWERCIVFLYSAYNSIELCKHLTQVNSVNETETSFALIERTIFLYWLIWASWVSQLCQTFKMNAKMEMIYMRCRWWWMCLRFVTLENKSIITYFFFCSVSLRKWAITDITVRQSIFGDLYEIKIQKYNRFYWTFNKKSR